MRAASKQPSVKRVVLTSSSAALAPSLAVPVVLTSDMYNDEAVKLAWEGKLSPPEQVNAVYCASKVSAEKACWKFVEDEKPGFQFSTVVPNMNFGPVVGKGQSGSSSALVGMIVNGMGDKAPTALFQSRKPCSTIIRLSH